MSASTLPSALLPSGLLGARVATRDRTGPFVSLGWPGLDSARPSIDILTFDHSGSVAAVGGNDPIGNRLREAEHALATVAAWCWNSKAKAIVTHFDQPSSGDSKLVTLSKYRALEQLRGALQVPRNAAGTSDLMPSLLRARSIAALHPNHDVRWTIFSDFEITDEMPERVLGRLRKFPGEVHAVVLEVAPPPELDGDNVFITTLGHDDPPGAIAASVHASLTRTRRGARSSMIRGGSGPTREWRSPSMIAPSGGKSDE